MYRHSQTRSGIYQAETEIEIPRAPRGARGFMPTFCAPFQGAFTNPSVAAKWWLSGGIAAANCIAAYQPKGAASLAASYVNLANPGTYDAAPGVAPSFDTATGWGFNGLSTYLETNVVPHAGWSLIIRFSNGATTGLDCGICDIYNGNETSRFGIYGNSTPGITYTYGTYQNVVPVLASGVLAIVSGQPYRNGIAEGALMINFTTANARTCQPGRQNAAVPSYFAGKIQALAIYNTSIAAQIVALTAAMAAL